MLGAPLDRGFNRLAWFLPYLVGCGSGCRLSGSPPYVGRAVQRRGTERRQRRPTAVLDERLDDELRNLD